MLFINHYYGRETWEVQGKRASCRGTCTKKDATLHKHYSLSSKIKSHANLRQKAAQKKSPNSRLPNNRHKSDSEEEHLFQRGTIQMSQKGQQPSTYSLGCKSQHPWWALPNADNWREPRVDGCKWVRSSSAPRLQYTMGTFVHFNSYIYQHALSWIFLPPPTIVSLLIIYFLLKSQWLFLSIRC